MDFEIKGTAQVQIDSLTAYMAALGFTFDGKSWVNAGLKHISRVSHRTAIALHNLPDTEWRLLPNKMYAPVIDGKVFDLAMNGYTLSRTQSAKLVQKVKMQPNRKVEEGIMLQNHMVKPYKPYMAVTLGLVE